MARQQRSQPTEALHTLEIDNLQLDPENPRLPESLLGADQTRLLTWLHDEGALEELARSMIENGYFYHEPLIVMRETDGQYTVLEGNRRFATVSILLQTDCAVSAGLKFLTTDDASPQQLDRLRTLPCYTVRSREEVRKFLGFRHIGGLKTWSPESKARYLEREIEDEVAKNARFPFREVARRVGSTPQAVRGQYLAIWTLRLAEDFGIPIGDILRNRFGVWTRLLNSAEVRDYIGLASPKSYSEIQSSRERVDPEKFRRVLSDLTSFESRPPVLADSRNVTIYGKVIADERANEILSKTRNLTTARRAVERASLLHRLNEIEDSLNFLLDSIDSFDVGKMEIDAAELVNKSSRNLFSVIKTIAEERIEAND